MSEKLNNIIAMSKEVEFGGNTYTISKLPLGKYAKVLLILKTMPTKVLTDMSKIDKDDEGSFINAILGAAAESWEQVVDVISLGSGLSKKTIAEDPTIGLEGGIELLNAIWEINNLQNVFNTVKNAMTRKMEK